MAIVLAISQMVIVLFSWIVSSVAPTLSCRSILSGEGLRWFLGSFVDNISSPLLVWLILLAIAYGSCVHSGLKDAFITFRKSDYRQRHAVSVSITAAVVILLIFSLLSFVPHAMLLGVSGSLFPSAFSSALIPVLAFVVVVSSIIYGIACGRYLTVKETFKSIYVGYYMFAPVFPIYIMAVQLYYSVCYVFIV